MRLGFQELKVGYDSTASRRGGRLMLGLARYREGGAGDRYWAEGTATGIRSSRMFKRRVRSVGASNTGSKAHRSPEAKRLRCSSVEGSVSVIGGVWSLRPWLRRR